MSTVLCMPNWRAICSEAGATIEEETGDIKVKEEMMKVISHLCL